MQYWLTVPTSRKVNRYYVNLFRKRFFWYCFFLFPSITGVCASSTENQSFFKTWMTRFINSILYVFPLLHTFITSQGMMYFCFGAFFLFHIFLSMINISSPFLYCKHLLLFQLYSTILSPIFWLAFLRFLLLHQYVFSVRLQVFERLHNLLYNVIIFSAKRHTTINFFFFWLSSVTQFKGSLQSKLLIRIIVKTCDILWQVFDPIQTPLCLFY